MVGGHISNVVAFDDAPFERQQTTPVPIVGTVFSDLRLDGILIGSVEKDGDHAAEEIGDLLTKSKFMAHARLIMLQGVTVGGFNIVDAEALMQQTGLPVIAVTRRLPDFEAIQSALQSGVPNGDAKWQRLQRLGPPKPVDDIFLQHFGLTLEQGVATVRHFSVHSNIPEPIRVAHLVAGALISGASRGQP